MNKFKNYLVESSIQPAKMSAGRYSFGDRVKLLQDIGGLKRGDFLTLIPVDEDCIPIRLGGIGEYGLLDEATSNKICLHAGPKIVDNLFELFPAPVPEPKVEEKPQASQAYPPIQRVITERIIVEQGEKGERGERGAQGNIGQTGPSGPAGPIGPKGDKGDKGDVGERGPEGPTGPAGPTGPQGERGETGPKGDRGERGEAGPIGPQGEQGLSGKDGATGPQGPAGIAGEAGPIGPQGPKGEKGDKGDKGDIGPQGNIGPIGPQGPAGVAGEAGPIGPQGPKGDTGIATAIYPLKLEDTTLSVEQKFFEDLWSNGNKGSIAQSSGGGNVDIYVNGQKTVKNLRSIDFGDGLSVTKEGRGNKITVTATGAGCRFTYAPTPPTDPVPIHGDRWFNSTTGKYFVYMDDGDSEQWVEISVVPSVNLAPSYATTTVTTSSYQATSLDYYIGVNYAGIVTITLPSFPDNGKKITVKDESGNCSGSNRYILIQSADTNDLIDNDDNVILNIDNGGLQFIYNNGWRIV